MHPLRDVILKNNRYREGGYLGILVIFAMFSAIITIHQDNDLLEAYKVWPFVLLSSFGLCFYIIGTSVVLNHGNISEFYPIIRASPAFIVFVGFLFMNQSYSPMMLAGIALVIIGAFMIQFKGRAHLLSDPRTLSIALLAMAGHGIATIADSIAVKTVPPGTQLFWTNVLTFLIWISFDKALGRSNPTVARTMILGWTHMPFQIVSASILSFVSYYLILLVFQMGANVAAVSTLRQVSIPLSVIFGGYMLKELGASKRFYWSLLLAAGVAIIISSRY